MEVEMNFERLGEDIFTYLWLQFGISPLKIPNAQRKLDTHTVQILQSVVRSVNLHQILYREVFSKLFEAEIIRLESLLDSKENLFDFIIVVIESVYQKSEKRPTYDVSSKVILSLTVPTETVLFLDSKGLQTYIKNVPLFWNKFFTSRLSEEFYRNGGLEVLHEKCEWMSHVDPYLKSFISKECVPYTGVDLHEKYNVFLANCKHSVSGTAKSMEVPKEKKEYGNIFGYIWQYHPRFGVFPNEFMLAEEIFENPLDKKFPFGRLFRSCVLEEKEKPQKIKKWIQFQKMKYKMQVQSEEPIKPTPIESEEPVHINVPTQSKTPVGTEVPTQSKAPVESELPIESETSIEFQTPIESNAPVNMKVSIEPEASIEPEVRIKFQKTIESEEPESPIESEAPVNTKVPIEPEAPVNTKVPIEPESPIESEAPVNTKVPIEPEGTVEAELLISSDSPMKLTPIGLKTLKSLDALITLTPIEHSTPNGSEMPVESEGPFEFQVPVQSVLPIESEASIEFQTPIESKTPINIKVSIEPAASIEPKAPIKFQKTIESEEPVYINVPTQSKTPLGTEVPTQPKAPVESELPIESEASIEFQTPIESKAPVNIKVSIEHEASIEPEVPIKFQKPIESEEPVNTKVPSEPESPMESETSVKIKVPIEPEMTAEAKLLVSSDSPMKLTPIELKTLKSLDALITLTPIEYSIMNESEMPVESEVPIEFQLSFESDPSVEPVRPAERHKKVNDDVKIKRTWFSRDESAIEAEELADEGSNPCAEVSSMQDVAYRKLSKVNFLSMTLPEKVDIEFSGNQADSQDSSQLNANNKKKRYKAENYSSLYFNDAPTPGKDEIKKLSHAGNNQEKETLPVKGSLQLPKLYESTLTSNEKERQVMSVESNTGEKIDGEDSPWLREETFRNNDGLKSAIDEWIAKWEGQKLTFGNFVKQPEKITKQSKLQIKDSLASEKGKSSIEGMSRDKNKNDGNHTTEGEMHRNLTVEDKIEQDKLPKEDNPSGSTIRNMHRVRARVSYSSVLAIARIWEKHLSQMYPQLVVKVNKNTVAVLRNFGRVKNPCHCGKLKCRKTADCSRPVSRSSSTDRSRSRNHKESIGRSKSVGHTPDHFTVIVESNPKKVYFFCEDKDSSSLTGIAPEVEIPARYFPLENERILDRFAEDVLEYLLRSHQVPRCHFCVTDNKCNYYEPHDLVSQIALSVVYSQMRCRKWLHNCFVRVPKWRFADRISTFATFCDITNSLVKCETKNFKNDIFKVVLASLAVPIELTLFLTCSGVRPFTEYFSVSWRIFFSIRLAREFERLGGIMAFYKYCSEYNSSKPDKKRIFREGLVYNEKDTNSIYSKLVKGWLEVQVPDTLGLSQYFGLPIAINQPRQAEIGSDSYLEPSRGPPLAAPKIAKTERKKKNKHRR